MIATSLSNIRNRYKLSTSKTDDGILSIITKKTGQPELISGK